MDTQAAVDRVELLIPMLDSNMKPLLETVVREARYMQVIRELVAGNISIEEEDG